MGVGFGGGLDLVCGAPPYHRLTMGFNDWLWGVYEYLCFLIGGIIVAINEANPWVRVKRKYFQKLPSVRLYSL